MSKTILVTGGAGHVGSHIIEILVKDPNNKVISLDNYFNGSTDNHINGAEYRSGHTKDIDKLIPETPDIVFHLGEYARVAPSFDDVEKVYDMNIVGTFAVVEFCRKRGVGKLVYAASSTKFAIEGDGRHQNPYSFTKATNIDLINNYGRWYNLPFAICYFYNAFGPREKGIGAYATLIAKFEQIYLSGEPFTVVKPGTQKRNFTYVKDLARGIILTAQKGQGDGYTLGNTKGYSIIEIAQAFGGPIKYIDGYPGRTESGDAPNKAREELAWDTTIDIIDYIKDFVEKHPKRSREI
ncbi:MAG: NAD-dependent epimerase/dehydratase family protein [Candidatus Shapirobacteria bacterium]|nr:NAD-dependent epimerase/dehydratase family protein [Candidatus Shapirobacteria bacterium]